SRRLKKFYDVAEALTDVSVSYDVKRDKAAANQSYGGQKLSSEKGLEIAVLKPMSVSFSQLAPYCGWETFSKTVMERLALWRRATGDVAISRVGLRFVN